MSEKIKKLAIGEFVKLGLLQEINRQFLHPRGLALSVYYAVDGEVSLNDIWDYRDDPEGLRFGDDVISSEEAKIKANKASELLNNKINFRQKNLGYVIQPIGDSNE